MHRTPKTPSKRSNKILPVTWLAQVILVDQMDGENPGFIAQIKGKLTLQQF